MEERLLTRFEWGLTADVQSPDFETRIAIIKRKAELLEFHLPDQVAEYIANKLKIIYVNWKVLLKSSSLLFIGRSAPSIKTAQAAISDIINNDQPAPMTIEKLLKR